MRQLLIRDDNKRKVYIEYDEHTDPTGELEEAQTREFDALERDEIQASDLEIGHRRKALDAAQKALTASQNERKEIEARHEARRHEARRARRASRHVNRPILPPYPAERGV